MHTGYKEMENAFGGIARKVRAYCRKRLKEMGRRSLKRFGAWIAGVMAAAFSSGLAEFLAGWGWIPQ
jgi:hypothetical protein